MCGSGVNMQFRIQLQSVKIYFGKTNQRNKVTRKKAVYNTKTKLELTRKLQIKITYLYTLNLYNMSQNRQGCVKFVDA